MKLSDKDLEELIYEVLRRLPNGNDRFVAKVIVDHLLDVEMKQLSDLRD